MNILICGGAGYIGSHMAKILNNRDHRITIFDNLSTGHKEAVKWGGFVQGDLLSAEDLDKVFNSDNFDAVMHFSAKSLVNESMGDPALYYLNNVSGTINLLEAMGKYEVKKFVFSSSAAVFGNPVKDVIDETHPRVPMNPYGETKLMVEKILKDYASAFDLSSVSLRYFNAAGADPHGEIGESHNPETHLIPNVLKAVLENKVRLKVFGKDYNTKDGTCVRDYIHINDLCMAHLNALEYMEEKKGAHGFNLGNGRGFSILEIIRAAEDVTGNKIEFDYKPPRTGDPKILVADSSLAKNKLDFSPEYTDIAEIIQTAWVWHQNQKY